MNLFFDYPIQFSTALVVLILMLQGKRFLAMYVFYGVAVLLYVVKAVGFDQFLAGVFVGVFASGEKDTHFYLPSQLTAAFETTQCGKALVPMLH